MLFECSHLTKPRTVLSRGRSALSGVIILGPDGIWKISGLPEALASVVMYAGVESWGSESSLTQDSQALATWEDGVTAEPWITSGQALMATVLVKSPRGTSANPSQKAGGVRRWEQGYHQENWPLFKRIVRIAAMSRGGGRGSGRTMWTVVSERGDLNRGGLRSHRQPNPRPYSLNRWLLP